MSNLQAIAKIDPHHHLWDLDHNPYPWLQGPRGWRTYGDYAAMCKNYLIDDFLVDSKPHNVVASVHVQANWDAADPVGETRWVQSVADEHGFPHGIVGHANLGAADVDAVLEAHCEYKNMRGIRDIHGHTDDPDCTKRPDRLVDPAWERGYARLARYNLSFDLQGFPSQLIRFAPIAARHQDIPVVICHNGFPWDRSPAGLELWRQGMSALAALPHCHVKLSGPEMVMTGWTVESYGDFIHGAIDLFGPERCMFASNVPPDALRKTYDDIYKAFYAWAERYSDAECRALFHDSAQGFYRL